MKPIFKVAKRVLQSVTARIYEGRPLTTWPSILGRVHEVRIPQSVIPNTSCSPTGSANINILLALLDDTEEVPGDVAECGVFRGGSLVPMAIHLRQKRSSKTIFGFDSFEGFSESIKIDLELGGGESDPEKKVGGLSDTSLELVQSKLARFHLSNALLAKGYFKESLPKYQDHRFSFVHLDCDMYTAYKECLEFFYPRLNSGGVLLFDEYNDPYWPGCNVAVDEFLRDKPEKVHAIVRDNFQKFFVAKGSETEKGLAKSARAGGP
jgi:O-methyltransferase